MVVTSEKQEGHGELPTLWCSEVVLPSAVGLVMLTLVVSLTKSTFEVSAETSFRH